MIDTVILDGELSLTNMLDGEAGDVLRVGHDSIIESLSVTENGTYETTEGVDGYAPVNVNVPIPSPVVESLSVTENGTYEAPDGVNGYNPVTVNIPMVLFKTVTLAEDHKTDAVGNPIYWHDYLGIDDEANYIYVCVFTNNTATASYRASCIAYFAKTGGVSPMHINYRNSYTAVATNYVSNRSLYATAGTVINVYRIPK